jgi:ABC-type Fe3+-hydroxamate transport system substrate-binding protein
LFYAPAKLAGLCRCYLDWENERETLVAAGVNRPYLLFAANLQASPVTATDIAGREVTLQQPAKRVILADARAIQA